MMATAVMERPGPQPEGCTPEPGECGSLHESAGKHPWDVFFQGLKPPRVRTYREFAEDEIILPPGGPEQGLPFRCEYMPWTGLVLDEFSRGQYNRFFACGAVQSGKTLLFFVIPTLYHLFEIGETVIIGVPMVEMAQSIYEERLEPVIRRTKYAELTPKKGSGSRGGKFRSVRFENGAILRFMGSGGKTSQRVSHTGRVIVMTEIDKMVAADVSTDPEAGPTKQIEARSKAYGDDALVFGECTVSTKTGNIWTEVVEKGTDTRPYIQCPKCKAYVFPERAGLVGWREAEDVIDARERACFDCPKCEEVWTERDRQAALNHPVLVSKGQEITSRGKVIGDAPRTQTFGFRWNAMGSPMCTIAILAQEEWTAEHSEDPDDAKILTQQRWTLPYEEDRVDLSGLNLAIIKAKMTRHPQGIAPPGTEKLTVFIDLGLYYCWWDAWAWMPGATGHLIDYGMLEVIHPRERDPQNITTALREFRDNILKPGWICDGQAIEPDLVLVDAAWQADIVYAFVRESGQGRYFASHGQGTSKNMPAWRKVKANKDQAVGNNWVLSRQVKQKGQQQIRLVLMHVDYWKRKIHDGFVAAPGKPGSLHLYSAGPDDHRQYARHIMAEREEEVFAPGKGMKRQWRALDVQNHHLDCAVGARCAADMLGIRETAPVVTETAGTSAGYAPAQKKKGWKIGR